MNLPMQSSHPMTPQRILADLVTPTDRLRVAPGGVLEIDGCRVTELVEHFGSPLYVLSETTFRANIRRVTAAFEASWPAVVQVLYAIKANSTLALRAIAYEEGVGSDCALLGELHATFSAGADARTVILNGSNKQDVEIAEAVRRGAVVVIDAPEDLSRVAALASAANTRARVIVRLRSIDQDYFLNSQSDLLVEKRAFLDAAERKKWGVDRDGGVRLVREAMAQPLVTLEGFHTHLGRWSRDVALFERNLTCFAELVAEISGVTGYRPLTIDVGGGWPRLRDPEAGVGTLNPNAIEDYARAVCSAMRNVFERAGMTLPSLWIEPGRFLVGNAGLLLATVGIVKTIAKRTWVNLDASNELMSCISLLRQANAVIPATGMDRSLEASADVVGSLCVSERFAADCALPRMQRGDLVAILDAGAYAECMASQFNSIPRPATVLLKEGRAELVRRRETIEDIFALQQLPDRLSQPR